MASTRRQRQGLKGVTSLRRKLRRIPDDIENKIGLALESGANAMALTMRGITPAATGTVIQNIGYKMSRDGLTARIGIIGKAKARDSFYFAFLDAGTKGDPSRNIPPMQALHIRQRAFDANSAETIRRVRIEINKTLKRLANA